MFFPADRSSDGGLPLETTQIGLVSYGVLKPKTWLGGPEEAGFYHMKGVIHSLLNLLGISDVKYLPKAGMPFHPGRSAKIAAHMSTVGEIETCTCLSRGAGYPRVVISAGFPWTACCPW